MDISSIIIEARKEMMDFVLRELSSLKEVEIHQIIDTGKIVALLETDTPDSAIKLNQKILLIPGVNNIQMAYHYYEH
jgi:nitrate reductase NapAB chaperone NapD